MRYKIEDNRLVISVDQDEITEILERREESEEYYGGSDGEMYDIFERMICNSELQWIDPEETGDLTDAPMLGIVGPEQRGPQQPNAPHQEVGCGDGYVMWKVITHRWAFMDYMVRSPVDDLISKGQCVFVGGEL